MPHRSVDKRSAKRTIGVVEQPVEIGAHFKRQPFWKIALGVPLIYVPIIVSIPFILFGVILVRTHLRFVGGHKLKGYWDFVPPWATHRYTYETQIVPSDVRWYHPLVRSRAFWIFNGIVD